MARTLTGRLVTPQGVVKGSLTFERHIDGITETGTDGPYILPGFIDTHVHGGGGGDTMDGAEGVRTLARFHLQHGTTTLYPTTITNPWEAILNALAGVREVIDQADPTLPDLPGAHLEGPFISPDRLGAQPPFAVTPDESKLQTLLEFDVIRLVTLAPEIAGALAAARRFAEAGVRVSVGHTTADYDTTLTLVRTVEEMGGTVGFTHLYNAMGGLAGRQPGVVGAALAHPSAYAELIFDGHHVHAGSFLAACAAKPEHLSLITDAIRACGLPEGDTSLGGQTVTVQHGSARLPDGTLAGSLLTLDQALRNAVAASVPLEHASRMLSGTPARYMGLTDRGMLAKDHRADLVVLDHDLQVLEVYVAGERVVG